MRTSSRAFAQAPSERYLTMHQPAAYQRAFDEPAILLSSQSPNVHEFPGHIACDAASRSEIVVPLVRGNKLFGVLDLDSPELARFDQEDAEGLAVAVQLLLAHSDLSRLV